VPETYVGTSGAAGSAGIWTTIVTIAGVDVTARIVGDIRIDAEEDSARVADLTIAPASTSFTVAAWVGKPITIDIAAMHTGSPTSVERLFTGIIDTPVLDLAGRRIGLRCTDDLQGVVEAMDAAAIDAAIPDGYYSPAIFDPAARGWSRAQDRLSTVPASLDLTPAGALRLTAWQPKTVADIAFTDAHLLDGSLSVSIAGANDLTNSVAIDFGYRFPRVKAETYSVGYDYVNAGTISDFAAALSWFLQRSAVESALKSAGAKIVAISYTPLPGSGIGSWVPGPYDGELCMGFTATVTFDYGQTIEERFTITVSAPNSISAVGTRRDRLSGALEGVYPPIVAAETSMLLYGNAISSIPPQDTAAGVIGQTTSAEVTLTPDSDRAAADAAMETLIAIAKTKIWPSHRHNTVGVRRAESLDRRRQNHRHHRARPLRARQVPVADAPPVPGDRRSHHRLCHRPVLRGRHRRRPRRNPHRRARRLDASLHHPGRRAHRRFQLPRRRRPRLDHHLPRR